MKVKKQIKKLPVILSLGIFNWCPEINQHDMISANDYSAFRYASRNGHLHIIEHLWHLPIMNSTRQLMIASDYYSAFVMASSNGHLTILEKLYEYCISDSRQTMLQTDNFIAFGVAVVNGDINVVRLLYSWCDQKAEMIGSDNHYPFRSAIEKNHFDILYHLYIWSSMKERSALREIKSFDFMDYIDLVTERRYNCLNNFRFLTFFS